MQLPAVFLKEGGDMKVLLAFIVFFVFAGEANAYLTASPSSVNFFNTEVGSFGRSQTVYIRNNSDEDVNVNVSDSCFGDFSTSGFCGYLSRWNSCSIRVQFRPRRAGSQSCNITVRQITGGFDSVTIYVRGRGVERRR